MKGWIYSLRADRSSSGAGIVAAFLNDIKRCAKKRGDSYKIEMDYYGHTKSAEHQIQPGDFMAIYHGPRAKFRRREALECPQITLAGIVKSVHQYSRDDGGLVDRPGRYVSDFSLLIPEKAWQVFMIGGLKDKRPNKGIFRDLIPDSGQYAFKEMPQSKIEQIQQWILQTYDEDQME